MKSAESKTIIAVWLVVMFDIVLDLAARSMQPLLFTRIVGCLDTAGIIEFASVAAMFGLGWAYRKAWLWTGMLGGLLLGITFLFQKTMILGCR